MGPRAAVARAVLWGALLGAGLAGAPALGVPLERGQRACVLALNASGAAVARAQAREALYCLEQAARGKEPDPQACLAADGRGKLARSRSRLEARGAKRCKAPLPPFGYTGPGEIGDHAVAEATGLTADVFGPDLTKIAAGAGSGAACQGAVAKGSEQVLAAFLQRAGKAKGAALAGPAPVADGEALAQAILAALASGADAKLERAAEKLAKGTGRSCAGADLAALLPGACASAADPAALAACTNVRARCRACQALAQFDLLPLDCDALDDALDNASCTSFFPGLAASAPGPGEADVSPTRWLSLEFDTEVPAERLGDLELRCDGILQAIRALPGQGTTLFVVPAEALPEGASCELRWPASDGSVPFATGAALPVVLYDRTDPFLFAPFPDDAILEDDPLTATGKRIAFVVPPYPPGLLRAVAQGISASLARRDGFSPQQPLVIPLSAALDPATIPVDAAASLDPGASVGLFDVDPGSPDLGERIPFVAILRSDAAGGGQTDHSLILLPAADLREGGHYALAVTREAHAMGGAAFGPSGFFERVLLADSAGPAEVLEARAALAPALAALENEVSPAIFPADLALAVAISVRSSFSDPGDWVSVKEQTLASPPVVLVPTQTQDFPDAVVYRGTAELPLWLDDSLTEVTRDVGGAPLSLATDSVPFVFRIPKAAPTPMPIVIYQHGSPGSPNEILGGNSQFLIDAGYAMLGIQDLTNRRFGEDVTAQTTETIGRLAFLHALPLTNFQTHADMMALLRAIQGMGQAGNFPEIDPTRILFRGISFGAHHSLAFLPFAPEVTAAASHVGSGRLFHANLHQLDYNGLLDGVLAALPGARPRDAIAGFAAVQNEQDRDDSHLLARFLYREPLAIEGLADTTPPSLLWIEGIGDSLVPNVATRASAVELGIPSVRPVPGPSPVLTEVDAPQSENIAPGVTAGHFQYDPVLTPSCVLVGQAEGHFCAQGADEVDAQVLHFYSTALAGAAEIVDPFP